MAKKTTALGAGIAEETVENEAAEKMSKVSKQAKTFDDFLQAQREAEAKSLKPRSGDFEVLKDVSEKDIRILQGFDESNPLAPPNPSNARLVGFTQFGKSNVCLVLKEAFIEKKESLKS